MAFFRKELSRDESRAKRVRSRRGFTLLEVILAAAIFTLTASALFVTFRTGVRAWRIGHTASESMQTARITQDLVTRDLHNVAYLPEAEYNRSFRQQVDQLSAQLQEDGEEEAAEQLLGRGDVTQLEDEAATEPAQTQYDPFLNINTLATPIDLSFHATDGGLLDEIEFARYQRPRATEEVDNIGIRRVRYFVEEGVLYREEASISGFRPGEEFVDVFRQDPAKETVVRSFIGPGAAGGDEAAGPLPAMEVDLSETTLAEPLCEGVEVFDLAFGYFRFGQWNEAPDWDSNAYQYRFPRGEVEDMQERIQTRRPAEISAGRLRTETSYAPELGGVMTQGLPRSLIAEVDGQPQRFSIRPDNLPGYVAIQLGVRDSEQGGRLRSFTFFVSLPMAREEFDTTQIDLPERLGVAEPAAAPRPEPARNLFVQ